MKNTEIVEAVRKFLGHFIESVPHVRSLDFGSGNTESPLDLKIEVMTDRDIHHLAVTVKGSGEPRYAREAIALLSMELRKSSRKWYPVFAAPFISRSAAEICLEADAGYVDLAGNCRLAFDGIFIERQGQPNKFASARSLRSLYQARSSRVLRALLFNPNLTWKLSDLSQAAGVSIGLVFNVKKILIDREWAVFDREGLRLTQPQQVLRDWGVHYSFGKNTLFNFLSPDSPPELESKLAERLSSEKCRYALTSFSAFARMTTESRGTRVYAYVDSDIDHVADLLHLEPAVSAPNVNLMLPYDEGVFYGVRRIEGVDTVSQIQAYLDLVGLNEEGEKAAEILFRQVIETEWQSQPQSSADSRRSSV
jgi:hypothetical protein